MSKRYTRKELEKLHLHNLILSLDLIQRSAKELRELNLTDEEWKAEEPSNNVLRGKELVRYVNILNYIIHPSMGLAEQLLPGAKQLIDVCNKNYENSIKEGVFKKCDCPGCS